MKRKLIRQGSSTLTISLPSSWTKRFNLQPGTEVDVEDKGRELCLFPEKDFTSRKTTIDVTGFNRTMIRYYINSLYIRGDEEIEVRYDDPKQFEILQSSLDFVMGYAIITQCSKSCTIKDLSGNTNVEFEPILRRVFYMIISFGEDGLEMMEKKERLGTFWRRDLTIDKYIFYSLRMLTKKGHEDFEKTRLYYNLLLLMEHLADEYSRFFRNAEQNHENITGKIKKLLKEVNTMFKDFSDVFYKYDKKKVQEILESKRKIREKLLKDNNPLNYYLTKIPESIANLIQIYLQLVL